MAIVLGLPVNGPPGQISSAGLPQALPGKGQPSPGGSFRDLQIGNGHRCAAIKTWHALHEQSVVPNGEGLSPKLPIRTLFSLSLISSSCKSFLLEKEGANHLTIIGECLIHSLH